MITRKQYMNKEASHHDYYIQFATDETRRLVVRHIGEDRIKKSICEHFNDIPLAYWDTLNEALKLTIRQRQKGAAEGFKPGTFGWSLSDAVCIAKAVANEVRDGTPPMVPSMETLKRAKSGNDHAQRVMYLDYVNDFLTVAGFASHYGLGARSAEVYINDWRDVHEAHVAALKG